MSIHPLVMAELKARAAALELRAEQLDYRIPGESASKAASRRYWERMRAQAMARDYRALIACAETASDD